MRKCLFALLLAFAAGSVQAQFERIYLDGAVQLNLRQAGERDEVAVMGDDEVKELVQVHVSGNRLIINTQGSWKFWNKNRPQVNVQVKNLTHLMISGASDVYASGKFKVENLSLHISGAGNVRFDELTADVLRFDVSGAGDGQMAGVVQDLRLNLSGKGKLQADQLKATSARVNISGVGNAQLWVTDSLRMNISGVGTIDYWGQPQSVARSSSGLATINARGDKR